METPATVEASKDFTMQLNSVYDQYILLKNALINSDGSKAKQAGQKVQKALSGVDMKLLTGDAHMQWMAALDILNEYINVISSTKDVVKQRSAFISYSEQFYKAIKTFGLMDKTVYYQFCPMANNGKGAYWLSETREIRNPFYGDEMLTCGETKDTLKY
jgi:Cu(I)/Ag(I) efflux system membrane fusion protein